MAENFDIGEVDRRARTAGYSDGLLEIFASVVLLVLASGWIANPGLVGILAAFAVLFGWKLVERVKARVTYPRIGYFRERSDEPGSSVRGMLLFIGGAFLLMVLVVFLAGGIGNATEWRRAAPLLSGLSLAGGFWYAGEQSGLVRYRLVAILSVALGVALWWSGSGSTYSGVVWHMLGLAIPLAGLGVWSLVQFIRTHPVRDFPNDG